MQSVNYQNSCDLNEKAALVGNVMLTDAYK